MHEQFLETHGLCYRTNDLKPGRDTLVFVHGLSGSSSAWAAYEEHFAGTCNLITFDIRGHGKSRRYAKFDDYSLRHFADDLEALLMHLGVQDVILISHSFGTMIAFEYLRTYSARVRATVFLSPIPSAWESFATGIIAPLLRLTQVLDFVPYHPTEGHHVDYRKYPNSGDWNIPRMIADISNTGMRSYLFCTRQSLMVNYIPLLSSLTLPTLIMHGTKDLISPLKNSYTLKERISNARLVTIENADHIVVLNHAPRICVEIEIFLTKYT